MLSLVTRPRHDIIVYKGVVKLRLKSESPWWNQDTGGGGGGEGVAEDQDVMRSGLPMSSTLGGSGYEELEANGVEEGRNDSALK